MSLLDRFKARLRRSRAALADGISGLFRGGRKIDPQLLSELEELLYTADLGSVASDVTAELARRHRRGELRGEEDVRSALRELLLAELGDPVEERATETKPRVILIVGVNGSGKTTTIAKLAHRYRSQGKRVLLGAADTFRAAAADQLEVWAQRGGADIVRQPSEGGSKADGGDPAAVAFDAVDTAVARGHDVVLIDTAGRLHTQSGLMSELEKVRRVVAKRLPGAPHEIWLVLDGTNGQNAIAQAREFTAAVGVTGLIVAKLDGTARGGAVFGIRRALGLPVRYIGTGESLELLEPFEPGAFVDALLASPAPPGPAVAGR
jgi:fused signal recognition particle receptor